MMNQDEFVTLIKKIRAMLASDAEARCSCPKTKCEWHGDCYNCVRIHRHFRDHVPNCLQSILSDGLKELARSAEMTVTPKPKTPDDYWDYMNEVAPRKPEDADGAQQGAK